MYKAVLWEQQLLLYFILSLQQFVKVAPGSSENSPLERVDLCPLP